MVCQAQPCRRHRCWNIFLMGGICRTSLAFALVIEVREVADRRSRGGVANTLHLGLPLEQSEPRRPRVGSSLRSER
jgi:hypothetical protein